MAIILPILSTFNAAGVKSAQSSLGALGKSLKGLAAPLAGAFAGFNALQGAINFAGDAISEARDLERNMAALGTVFGNLEPRMAAFAQNAYTMGLSQSEAARTATFLGSVLKQAGFGMDEVADNTEKLTILAQDLATTFGYDTSEALTAMTALFRGEYDPIEKFGVALKQNEVNALVAAKGLGKLTGQAMLNAQQVVRMEQLFLRSADAAGAFARQSGTLFVEQKKLTAVFSNMQAAVGTELTPAITTLMQALTPLVEENGPKLQELFRGIGLVIDALIPIVSPIIGFFGSLFETAGKLLQALDPLTKLMGAGFAVALELIVDLLNHILAPFNALFDAINKVFDAGNKDFGNLGITDFLRDMVAQGGLVASILSPVVKILDRIGEITNAQDINKGTRGETARFAAMSRFYDGKAKFERDARAAAAAAAGSGTKTKDVIAEFYKDLKDELDKQAARLKLERLGASTAFIESIVGSGEDWKKVFADVAKRGQDGIAKLQKQFNKTSAGLKEIADANEALAKTAQDAYDEAFKAYEKQLEVYEKQVEAINALKKALKELTTSVNPLAVVTREIGSFEQSTIDSFDNIAKSISDSVADGTMLKSAADALIKYARSEQAVIQDLMRQRDELVNRRSLAQALMADVKSTIIGMGNITEILAKNATDVTQTITKMVGNVQVATSKVIKGATGGASGLIASFTETLNKTKAFAQQLKDLRALGLDKNLYQQIVSAGIDAGGATAKAILEGGTGTVSELNSLFKELDTVGTEIAEQSAQVMYGAGIDLVDGLIAGMISKEQELVNYATTLANAFATAFSDRVNLALPMPSAPIAPTLGSLTQTMAVNSALLDTFAVARDFAGSAENYYSGSESIRFANIAQRQGVPINITVNAGLGTDGKIVGQTIQSYINKYNKANSSF
jgi:hypothetical protein